MTNPDLDSFRDELKRELSIETIHQKLKLLSPGQAQQVVEGFSNFKVRMNVNVRQYQEDYIARYMLYLWEISQESFWKHIKASFNKYQGILWGDDMEYIGILCNNFIPEEVMKRIIEFLVEPELRSQDKEGISCIIKAQVLKFDRSSDIAALIDKLPKKLRGQASTYIAEMVIAECNFHFE